MKRVSALFAGVLGLLAAWVAWGLYATRTAERVPYETVERVDGIEIRRYPRTVLVETTAPTESAAFRRLYRYLSGANERDADLAMTAPVATGTETVPKTAPVRSVRDERSVTMAFYLSAAYTPERAPVPTDPEVRLVVDPPKTLAVRRFSWYATRSRVDRERDRLLDALDRAGRETRGEPTLLRYNDPWTPPFMRRNEVAITVATD